MTMSDNRIGATVVAELLDLIDGRLKCIKVLSEGCDSVSSEAIASEVAFGQSIISKTREIYGLSRETLDDFDCPSRAKQKIL